MGEGLDVECIVVLFSGGPTELFVLQNILSSARAHPASYSMSIGDSLRGGKGVKRPCCYTDHSYPSHADFKEWSYNFTPTIHLLGVHSDKFTFKFLALFIIRISCCDIKYLRPLSAECVVHFVIYRVGQK